MANPTQFRLEQLIEKKPRETSGSSSSNRADYQKSWAFCLLLRLHSQPADYLVLLDFHDDVVVVDSVLEPTSIDFYQVKTKRSGNWTLSLLLKREKGKDEHELSSIIGKMYSNKLSFPDCTRSLTFVSNAQYNIQIKSPPAKKEVVDGFDLSQLCRETLIDFSKAIQEEHELPYSPLCDILTKFTTDPLSLDDHAAHAMGQFTNFLHQLKGDGKFAIQAGFRAITSVIAKKSNNEKIPSTKDELLAGKAISRSDFEEMLSTIISQEDERERWQDLRQTLSSEGRPFGEIHRWHSAWKKFVVQRMDPSNRILMEVRKGIGTAVAKSREENPSQTLYELICNSLCRFEQKQSTTALPYDRDYLVAIILFEASE